MHKFTDKESINSRLDCAVECNLGGVSGDEVIRRLTALHDHLKGINEALGGPNPINHANDFQITFTFEPNVKELWVSYISAKGQWKATFQNNASTLPRKSYTNYSRQSYYNKTNHTWNHKTSKYEGKIFDMIRDFVDNGIVP